MEEKETLMNEYSVIENEIKDINLKINEKIVEELKKLDVLNERKEKLKENIKKFMEEQEITKLENNLMKITYKEPYVRSSVDSKKLKEQYEEVYLDCLKKVNVSSSVSIKIKD